MDYMVPLVGLVDNYGEPLKRYPDEIFPGTNAALFNERGKVLLQRRRDNGRWGLPGGRMEIGESAAACAVREMFEETGVTTRVKRLVGAYSDPANYCVMRYPTGHITHYVILLYEVEYLSGNPGPSEESTEVPFEIPIGRCAVVEDPWGNRLVLVDLSRGLLVTDADGIVQTDAHGFPHVTPPPDR